MMSEAEKRRETETTLCIYLTPKKISGALLSAKWHVRQTGQYIETEKEIQFCF